MKSMGSKKSNFMRLLGFLKPYWKLQVWASIYLVGMAITALSIPWFTKIVIDEVIVGKNIQLLLIILLAVFTIYVFRQIFFFASHYLVFYVGQKVIFDIRSKLFRQLQFISIKYYDKRTVGTILSRIVNDVTAIEQFFMSGLIVIVVPTFTLIMALIIIVHISWKITLVALIVLPLYALSFYHYRRRMRSSSLKVRKKVSDMVGKANEVISGVRITRSFTAEGYEIKQFAQYGRQLLGLRINYHMLGVYLWMIADALAGIGTGTILCYGAWSVLKGSISLGDLTAILGYTAMLYNPIIQLTALNNVVQQAMAGVDRVFEVLDIKSKIKKPKHPVEIEQIKKNIVFDHVYYEYSRNTPVLKDIRFELKAGETVALVGHSGCGKSTLISLLLRFYDPTKGQIYLDGINIKQIDPRAIREITGIVLQEIFLFSGTIAENIRYGQRKATQEEIIEAARVANAHNFIMQLPKGYDTELYERGAGLSMGERQRISIARAVLRNPSIFILDEPTSALDSKSERVFQEILDRVMQERTTFIIAHRLSTVLQANKIMVMDQGRIVETGTHEELFLKNGFYRELCESQFIKSENTSYEEIK